MDTRPSKTAHAAQHQVHDLYRELLHQWNAKSAKGFSDLFHEQGWAVGFDGSELKGREGIFGELSRVFKDHQTGTYVGMVKEVRFPNADTALLHAVAGMIPAGENYINPGLNAIQTLVASKIKNEWRIELFQNTPAQFHGRPELAVALTAELAALI
ncbi:SgcJ/EcaC family oxidoreductase [Chryseolinea soli]|uniref:SgcJ/EcaC family oxidoreductase n=1 Tax=Chryseolinea soli TaxID=2321403 RepID=A0A385SV53_9BACT|nr:SgcJ/EcaC family oxidoreductase [Chryseolinea soli]AYB34426.1 SgcJ/EcaC family oxidoreductase [Chryseolinea soli]